MKLLFYILLGLAPIVRPPAAQAASNHEAHRLEAQTFAPHKKIPGLRISCQSLLPEDNLHGVPFYTLTFVNEQPVRRVIEVEVVQKGAVRRQIVLEPSASVSADFILPVSRQSYDMYNATLYVQEKGVSERVRYVGGFGACFEERYSQDPVNVLIGSAVDGIATAADYSHTDEQDKKKKLFLFQFYAQMMGESGWSADTRAYLGYDIVLLSAEEWASLSSGVRRALVGFAVQGGALILCGQEALPEEARGFALSAVDSQGTMQEHVVGVGRICLAPPIGANRRPPVSRKALSSMYIPTKSRVAGTSGLTGTLCGTLEEELPPLDIPTIPVSLFIILLAAFALVLVPVVLVRCIRRQQRIKALIILPLVSAGIGAVIVCCILFIYGVTPQLNAKSIVLLNATDRRAFVHTLAGIFTPTDVTRHLRFGRSMQVMVMDGDEGDRWKNVDMQLTYGNEMSACGKDWLTPLRPVVYVTNEMRDTNARLVVEDIADGKIKVTNLLGAPLTALYVVDAQGRAYVTGNLAEGATCELAATIPPVQRPPNEQVTVTHSESASFLLFGPDMSTKRLFFRAEMASCPFGTDLLGGTKAKRNLQTIVYGHYGKEGTK